MDKPADAPKQGESSRCGIAGLAISLVALVAAVLSPWILDTIEPQSKPIDEVAVDVAVKIKDRLIAKAKGEEYVPPPTEKPRFKLSKWYPAGTISLGLCAMCCGIIGFARHEDARVNGSAVTVGLAAILFQYFLLIAGALIIILLIAIVLSALGINLPTP